jgi:hypothetical protein
MITGLDSGIHVLSKIQEMGLPRRIPTLKMEKLRLDSAHVAASRNCFDATYPQSAPSARLRFCVVPA